MNRRGKIVCPQVNLRANGWGLEGEISDRAITVPGPAGVDRQPCHLQRQMSGRGNRD